MEKKMTNKEKIELFNSLTLQDVMDYLEGSVVQIKNTEYDVTLSQLSSRYCGSPYISRFTKSKILSAVMRNRIRIDMTKSLVEQLLSSKVYGIEDVFSKNRIKKCNSRDELVKTLFKLTSPFVHYNYSRYSYFFVKRLISRVGGFNSRKKSEALIKINNEIIELEKKLDVLKKRRSSLESHESMRMRIYGEE